MAEWNAAMSGVPVLSSSHSASENVAKPSLSQMSDHVLHVIMLPHHWCASSCAVMYSRKAPPPPWPVNDWCSMPPPNSNWYIPYWSLMNGYSPKNGLNAFIIAGIFSHSALFAAVLLTG